MGTLLSPRRESPCFHFRPQIPGLPSFSLESLTGRGVTQDFFRNVLSRSESCYCQGNSCVLRLCHKPTEGPFQTLWPQDLCGTGSLASSGDSMPTDLATLKSSRCGCVTWQSCSICLEAEVILDSLWGLQWFQEQMDPALAKAVSELWSMPKAEAGSLPSVLATGPQTHQRNGPLGLGHLRSADTCWQRSVCAEDASMGRRKGPGNSGRILALSTLHYLL